MNHDHDGDMTMTRRPLWKGIATNTTTPNPSSLSRVRWHSLLQLPHSPAFTHVTTAGSSAAARIIDAANIAGSLLLPATARDYARKMNWQNWCKKFPPPPPTTNDNNNSQEGQPLKRTVSSSNIPDITLQILLDGLSSVMPMFSFLMEMEEIATIWMQQLLQTTALLTEYIAMCLRLR